MKDGFQWSVVSFQLFRSRSISSVTRRAQIAHRGPRVSSARFREDHDEPPQAGGLPEALICFILQVNFFRWGSSNEVVPGHPDTGRRRILL
jgi:hypothetical protein